MKSAHYSIQNTIDAILLLNLKPAMITLNSFMIKKPSFSLENKKCNKFIIVNQTERMHSLTQRNLKRQRIFQVNQTRSIVLLKVKVLSPRNVKMKLNKTISKGKIAFLLLKEQLLMKVFQSEILYHSQRHSNKFNHLKISIFPRRIILK